MINIQENAFMFSQYDEVNKIIYIKYFGLFNSEAFEEGMTIIIQFLMSNPNFYLFQNLNEMSGSLTRSMGFITRIFIPNLEKNGLSCAVHCLNTDLFTKFAMQQMFEIYKFKHEVLVATSLEEGMIWLEQKTGSIVKVPQIFT